MRMTLLALTLAPLTAAVVADEKKAPPAQVRVAGDLSGSTLTTLGDLKIELGSSPAVAGVFAKATRAKLALVKEQLAATQKLLGDDKLKGKAREKALDKLKAEYKAKERSLVVAEGTLSVEDKKLRLAGTVRLASPKKDDKDLPAGGAVVEGEAQAGTFAYGKDKQGTLAIKNGAAPILVVGKAAEEERKGKVRAYGVLKQGDKGVLVLEATKVEEVK